VNVGENLAITGSVSRVCNTVTNALLTTDADIHSFLYCAYTADDMRDQTGSRDASHIAGGGCEKNSI